jgi:hypothetical protein
MKYRLILALITALLMTSTGMFAQQDFLEPPADVAFWVSYWARPKVVMFGPEEEAFNQNVHEILFPYNDHDEPSNPNVLDEKCAMVEGPCERSLLHRGVRVLQRRPDLQPCALAAKSGLGQTKSDIQGHSGKSHRAGGGVGGVVPGLSGDHRRMLDQEPARPLFLLSKLNRVSLRQ